MTIRVAINGYGRIGRCILRAIFEQKQDDRFEVVAINDLSGIKNTAHFTRYDSTHGRFAGTVEIIKHRLCVNGHSILITSESNPEHLPWGELNVDVVFECTDFCSGQ